jgi:DUF971 family protein
MGYEEGIYGGIGICVKAKHNVRVSYACIIKFNDSHDYSIYEYEFMTA